MKINRRVSEDGRRTCCSTGVTHRGALAVVSRLRLSVTVKPVSKRDISGTAERADGTQTCVRSAVSPPALPSVPSVPPGSSPSAQKRETKDRKNGGGGGNAELEECHFLFTTKGGGGCHRKVTGCLTPFLLPGCCQPPQAMMEGQTHSSFKYLPASPKSAAARHFLERPA